MRQALAHCGLMAATEKRELTTPAQLEQRLRENARTLAAASCGVDRITIDTMVDAPRRGAPAGGMTDQVARFAELAQACRPDLKRRGALAWLRRQLRGGEMAWAPMAQLCTGLGVDVSKLFAEVSP